MKKISFKEFIPAIIWFLAVLYIMCLPGNEIPKVEWLEKLNFDKVVHIGVFALLTLLFCWPFNQSSFTNKQRLQYFIKIAIAASLWGLTIEFIQKFYIPGRSYDLLDWAADSIGAFLAFWFCRKYFLNKSVKKV